MARPITYFKKPDLKTKAGKLFLAQQKGLTDTEASKVAGISKYNVPEIEATKTYQAIQKKFAETLLEKITMEQIAEKTAKNILQDEDKGASNTAIFKSLEKLEPENLPQQAQQVNIVLK